MQYQPTAAAYLAAMIDGEGHVTGPGPKRWDKAIRICNTEPDIIAAVRECCDALGITYTVCDLKRPARWRPPQEVVIRGRRNVEIVVRQVPLRSERKRARVAEMLASYRPTGPSDGELRRLYVAQRMSISEVAHEIGMSQTATRYRLHRAGIRVRTRAEGSSLRERRKRERDAEESSHK